MIGKPTVLIAILGAAALALLLAACKDEPTQQQAQEQFCDDAGAFLAALGDLRDINSDTTVDELEELRNHVRTTYDNMIESATDVREVKVDDLQEARDDLGSAVDDINDDATLQESLDSIKDEVDALAIQTSETLNDVDCGSGQGGQERSDE